METFTQSWRSWSSMRSCIQLGLCVSGSRPAGWRTVCQKDTVGLRRALPPPTWGTLGCGSPYWTSTSMCWLHWWLKKQKQEEVNDFWKLFLQNAVGGMFNEDVIIFKHSGNILLGGAAEADLEFSEWSCRAIWVGTRNKKSVSMSATVFFTMACSGWEPHLDA